MSDEKPQADWVAYLWEELPNGERNLVEETGVVGTTEEEALANADWVLYGEYEHDRTPNRTITVELEKREELCCECGLSVAFGSGNFVNRIPVDDDYDTRVEQGKSFPRGTFMCALCDEKCPLEDEKFYGVNDETDYRYGEDTEEDVFNIYGTIEVVEDGVVKDKETMIREGRAILGVHYGRLLREMPSLEVMILSLSPEHGWIDYSIEDKDGNEDVNRMARVRWIKISEEMCNDLFSRKQT